MNKRLESDAHDMPKVCEGCIWKTKVRVIDERGAFFVQYLSQGPGEEESQDGGRQEPDEHFRKSAPLSTRSFTFVLDAQPSHTFGMSFTPLSSQLLTFPGNPDTSHLIRLL